MIKHLTPDRSIQDLRDEADALALPAEEAREALARKYGFVTWRQLEVHLLAYFQAEQNNPENKKPNFQRLACLNYIHYDCPANWEQARKMLDEDPTLATADIYSACCVGDVQAVRGFLDKDPALVNEYGGYFGWPPLMYACYSRLNLPGKSTLEVARLLIDRGADPNPYYMWGGQYKFTALTGAFGEGEGGPVNMPEHADCEPLARLLLDGGAHPNDAQALYNRMFTPGSRCLELLLEYGLSDKDRCNWLLGNEHGLHENPQQTLQYQLMCAVGNHPERAKLLIDHGADLSTAEDETPFYKAATMAGNRELAEYLVANGAPRVELDSVAHFSCACMSGDRATAQTMLDAEPDLMQRLQDARTNLLHDAAGSNRLDAVRILADLGADLDRLNFNTPLHEAASRGHLEMIKLLIDKGATIGQRDHGYVATPLQWARHAGHQEIVDYLATCEIDIFDAIVCENFDRINALLDADPSLLEITLGELKSKPEAQDFDWMTPLAWAVARKLVEPVRLLLARGASTDLNDADGRSLLEIAQEASTPEIVGLLERHSS